MQFISITTPELLRKCSDLSIDVYNSEPWNDKWTRELAYERFETFFRTPNFHCVAAMEDNDLIACVLGNIEPYFSGAYFYLKEIFVSNTWQRKGIGERLIKEISSVAKNHGAASILLFTSNRLFPFNFYQKKGFKSLDDMAMLKLDI